MLTLERLAKVAILMCVLVGPVRGGSITTPTEQVDIVRGQGGTPQIFSKTDKGAFFGLGYATASDRLFQMEFSRCVMRGNLSALLPAPPPPLTVDLYAALRPAALFIDKRARALDWATRASQCISALTTSDPELVTLLNAYCAGVNKRLSETPGTYPWPPMFQAYGLTQMNNWTPEDCLLVWLRIEQYFNGNIEDEVAVSGATLSPTTIDSTGAVCSGSYLATCFLELLRGDTILRGIPPTEGPKASHNVVIAGDRTSTQRPMILGKPQLAVTAPNIHYEYSLHAEDNGVVTLDCRGVGFAGCPGILHGWNRHVAWSVTSMGCDNRDTYQLLISTTSPYDYWYNGAWQTMSHSPVTILNRANTVLAQFERGETVWGPLVTQYIADRLGPVPPTQGYAFHCMSLLETAAGRHSMRAMLGFMRAQDICDIRTAMHDWVGPGVDMLYADDTVLPPQMHGNIGYTALATCPQRPAGQDGRQPLDGTTSASAWGPNIPYDDLPHERNPSQGFLSTANNLAAPSNSWFYLTYQTILGAPGDGARSWRLREFWTNRLASTTPVTFLELQDFDHDVVVPPLRAVQTLARMVHAIRPFVGDALIAYNKLDAWNPTPLPPGTLVPNNNTDTPDMVTLYDFLGRFVTPLHPQQYQLNLAAAHGDGGSGVTNFFKKAEANGGALMQTYASDPDVQQWLIDRFTVAKHDLTTAGFSHYKNPFLIKYQTNFEAFGDTVDSLDPNHISATPTMQAASANTIWSQCGECYKFFADLATPDNNCSLLGLGVSEDPASPIYSVNQSKWIAGRTRVAPLTRAQIPGAVTTTIYY